MLRRGRRNPGGVKRKRTFPSYDMRNVDAWAATSVEEGETFSFLWNIDNYYPNFWNRGGEVIRSPICRGGPKNQHQWQLEIIPRHEKSVFPDPVARLWKLLFADPKTIYDHLSLFLVLREFGDGDKSEDRKIRVRVQMSLLNEKGKIKVTRGNLKPNPRRIFRQDQVSCIMKRGDRLDFSKFVWNEKLYTVITDLKKIRVHCQIFIEGEEKSKTGTNWVAPSDDMKLENIIDRGRKKFCQGLGPLLESQLLTDLTVRTAAKKLFKVHKAILAGRSPVFTAMLTGGMLEARADTIDVLDFEDDVVEGMIKFIYTGDVDEPLMANKAPELLQIAEKYDLPGLKELCAYKIGEKMNSDNSSEILLLAHYQNSDYLKEKAIKFINKNFEEVKETESFENLLKRNPLADLYFSTPPATTN